LSEEDDGEFRDAVRQSPAPSTHPIGETMKVYLVGGHIAVEVSPDYLLVICTKEVWDGLSITEQLAKVHEATASSHLDILDMKLTMN
jgi:hypothetical protein